MKKKKTETITIKISRETKRLIDINKAFSGEKSILEFMDKVIKKVNEERLKNKNHE